MRRSREPQDDLRREAPGDVPGCKGHTRLDQHGQTVRVARCTGGCRAWNEAQTGDRPLTRFLAKLLAYTPDQLRDADPVKAAKHYSLPVRVTVGYIQMQRETRGIR